jgi:hypothetical protein
VSLNKIANAKGIKSRADLEGAVTANRESLEIMRQILAKEPSNIQWQRDLTLTKEGGALILSNVGRTLKDQDDVVGAISAYPEVLDIRRIWPTGTQPTRSDNSILSWHLLGFSWPETSLAHG